MAKKGGASPSLHKVLQRLSPQMKLFQHNPSSETKVNIVMTQVIMVGSGGVGKSALTLQVTLLSHNKLHPCYHYYYHITCNIFHGTLKILISPFWI